MDLCAPRLSVGCERDGAMKKKIIGCIICGSDKVLIDSETQYPRNVKTLVLKRCCDECLSQWYIEITSRKAKLTYRLYRGFDWAPHYEEWKCVPKGCLAVSW